MTVQLLERPAAAPAAAPASLPLRQPLLRRAGKHPLLMHYHRLAALVLLANLVLGWLAVVRFGWWTADRIALTPISYAVLANLALAILIRQQYVINALFWLATRAPVHWPLTLRWTLAKVYHFGGLHLGGALAGTGWFLVFTGSLTYQAVRGTGGIPAGQLALTYALVGLLLVLVATALPPVRARCHDRFERVHRFGGWAALALFWLQAVLFLPALPAVPVLAVVTASVALPWLRLRRVPVRIERPSDHVALVRFDHGVTPFAGSSTAVSRRPLLEWHSFANVPAPGESGFRLTISRAGDWTGSFIDDAPSNVWVKGITTAGVANIETLFRKVVYVATGSGIGPVLPHLLAQQVPAHLVWATRSPRLTYGDWLVDEILTVQPHATIWDTSTHGKPDLVTMAYQAWRETGAEAVICISNKKLTWRVVHGLESRGIPAYGAIWDS